MKKTIQKKIEENRNWNGRTVKEQIHTIPQRLKYVD